MPVHIYELKPAMFFGKFGLLLNLQNLEYSEANFFGGLIFIISFVDTESDI